MILKVKGRYNGAHVRATLFCGEKKGSLANCGNICMREEEYRTFCATLLKGTYVGSRDTQFELEGYLSDENPLEDEDDNEIY